jgi:FMN phosphatase YigB (HAD superfamily)
MTDITDAIGACAAVVFDCAGTLLRLKPPSEVIFRDAAAEIGIDIPLAAVARAYELVEFAVKMRSSELNSEQAKDAFYLNFNRALCSALGILTFADRLHPILRRRFAARRHWTAFDDAAITLEALGRRIPIHALANWDRGLDGVLRHAGLRDLIGVAAASETLGAEKPSPACFEAFLALIQMEPARVVYVGNEYTADVVAARSVGMTPVLIDRDDKLPAADCLRVRNLGELLFG